MIKGHQIWVDGRYHTFMVDGDAPAPWRSLCTNAETHTLETKTPGSYPCTNCIRKALALASEALNRRKVDL